MSIEEGNIFDIRTRKPVRQAEALERQSKNELRLPFELYQVLKKECDEAHAKQKIDSKTWLSAVDQQLMRELESDMNECARTLLKSTPEQRASHPRFFDELLSVVERAQRVQHTKNQ